MQPRARAHNHASTNTHKPMDGHTLTTYTPTHDQGALKKCDRENRKSITADDLIWTLKQSSELNHYTDVVRNFTKKHRTIEATSRLSKREGDAYTYSCCDAYTYSCVGININMHKYICIHVCIHTYKYVYIHIHIHKCIHRYIYICRSIFTYPLTKEIRLETSGSLDWTVFPFTLLSDGDSVYSSEKHVWNFGDSRENVFDMYEDCCETC